VSPDVSDNELLARARRGDDAAFRAIVVRYESAVAGVVVGMLGPGDDADDVGQETFVHFHRALDSFRGDASLKTYLVRIAMNLSINALKQRARRGRRFLSLDRSLAVIPGAARDRAERSTEPAVCAVDPVDPATSELRDVVRAALDRLGPKHRPVVVLRLVDGYSTRETASILGVPEGTVLSRLSRALRELETLLAPYVRTGAAIAGGPRA
jgi:RNA polymerase sigma-70 factor (ECF subfamily)